ncbi:protein ABHD11-like [Argonauta hians]
MFTARNFKVFLREFPYINGLSSSKTQRNINKRFCSTLSYTCYPDTSRVDSSKKPLVILHGLFGSKTNWNTLSKALSRHGRKVIAVDSRNHGNSFHRPTMTYEEMCDDVAQLLSQLNIPDAIILGHSMGGKTAMVTALKYPQIVSSLIAVDIAPGVSPSVDVFPIYAEAMKRVKIDPTMNIAQARKSVTQQMKHVLKEFSLLSFMMTNLVEKDGKVMWRLNLDAIITGFQDIMLFPRFTNNYQGQTLFIAGGNSTYVRKSDEPEIQRLFPNSRVQYIPGAGHWVHAEKPTEFLAAVNSFLETLTD